LPRTPLPSGLVTDLPMGSSTTTSSAINAGHPSRSWACTQRHDACEAANAGVCTVWVIAVPPSLDGTRGAGALFGGFTDKAKAAAVAGGVHGGIGQSGDQRVEQCRVWFDRSGQDDAVGG